jgi:hypothetical protein
MSKYSKVMLVGIILIVFGVTLLATSYFRIYDTVETVLPTANVLPIQANSSSDFYFNSVEGLSPQPQTIFVLVTESRELQGILNSTLNYNSTMINDGKNVTITLFAGNQPISASERTWISQTSHETVAFHTFDFPSGQYFVDKISITNPYGYPVCWIVNVMAYGQLINTDWLAVFIVGLISIILGLIIVGVAGHRRKAVTKP